MVFNFTECLLRLNGVHEERMITDGDKSSIIELQEKREIGRHFNSLELWRGRKVYPQRNIILFSSTINQTLPSLPQLESNQIISSVFGIYRAQDSNLIKFYVRKQEAEMPEFI